MGELFNFVTLVVSRIDVCSGIKFFEEFGVEEPPLNERIWRELDSPNKLIELLRVACRF